MLVPFPLATAPLLISEIRGSDCCTVHPMQAEVRCGNIWCEAAFHRDGEWNSTGSFLLSD